MKWDEGRGSLGKYYTAHIGDVKADVYPVKRLSLTDPWGWSVSVQYLGDAATEEEAMNAAEKVLNKLTALLGDN